MKGNSMKKLFTLLSCVFALQASAEVLYFGGNIANTCTFSNSTNGRFSQIGPRNLDALDVGEPASITVSNNQAGAFKVSITQPSGWLTAPVGVSTTGFQVLPRVTGPNAGSGFTPNGNKIESVLQSTGVDTLAVGLLFEESSLSTLPEGEYSATVIVLCEATP